VSGICGFVQPDIEGAGARLDAMLKGLMLSGESVAARFTSAPLALAVARRWDFQQFASLDGVHVAADADLYNLAELKPWAAHTNGAPQNSIAALIAALYLSDGSGFVDRLQGAFSIAVWDEHQRELTLAVDRFGFKTLFWSCQGDRFVFASRIGGVAAAVDSPAEVDPAAVTQYLLFSAVSAPLSILRGVQRLEPGFCLTFTSGEPAVRRYWNLDYIEESGKDEDFWAQNLREKMRTAVHGHIADCSACATGAYLSGGTDSSSVTAFMSDLFKPVNTFSISFPVARYDEIGFARTTAETFSTNHHERCLSPADARAAIPKIISYYDEPFANSSAIASYYCALLARENGIDTLLAGDGGDELFGGNARYADDKRFALYDTVPSWLRRSLVEPLAKLLPSGETKLSLPRRYIRRASIPNPRRILSYNFFLNIDTQELFEPDFLSQAPESEWLAIAERHFKIAKASHELNRILYMDVKMTLADNDLRKVSGTAELAGVRVRYPLLDTRLAEFSGRIPATLKLKGMEKRYIFKRAMRGILPDKVLFKKKHGFGVPLGQWFLHDPQLKSLVGDVLGDSRTRQRGYFRPQFLDRLKQLHEREDAGFYGEIVWYVVALELWHRAHLESWREVSVAG